MLSPESKLVYDILRRLTGDDDIYKIIEAEEVFALLPSDVQYTKVQLSSIIKDLKERDYINVKYFTPDEYCLLTLKKIEEDEAHNNDENIIEGELASNDRKERILYDKNAKVVSNAKPGLVFLMAFLGAIVGSTLVAIVVTILSKTIL